MKSNFDNLSLERGMYSSGVNLTKVLEVIDPSENYRGTVLEGLDAFSRQLKRFDIKVSGQSSDTVEKFFQTGSTSVLFPEFVRRSVQAGMDENNMLSNIIASTTYIDGYDYRSISASQSDNQSTKFATKENLCKLHRRGRMLVASYESLRFQRLDLFSTMLRQIGANIKNAQFADAVQTLIDGDGNSNPAKIIIYDRDVFFSTDLLDVIQDMAGFSIHTIIAPFNLARQIIALPEYSAQISFGNDGVYHLPFNIKMIVSKAVDEQSIVCIDEYSALEMVVAGGLTLDYDKLIDRQLERAAISCTAGFSKIYEDATRRLYYNIG